MKKPIEEDKAVQIKPVADITAWTNTDVLLWLIRTDQKAFVPTFCTHNITGLLLQEIDLSEAAPAKDSSSTSLRLEALVGDGVSAPHMAGLRVHLKELVKSAKDAGDSSEENDPNKGWSFQHDLMALYELVGVLRHQQRLQCMSDTLHRTKDSIAIATLFISTVTTLVSVAATSWRGRRGERGGGREHDGDDIQHHHDGPFRHAHYTLGVQ